MVKIFIYRKGGGLKEFKRKLSDFNLIQFLSIHKMNTIFTRKETSK